MDKPKAEDGERLNKYLALRLGISRREADQYIENGRIGVDGQIAKLGTRVTEENSVSLDNKPIPDKPDYTYIELNKPVGYVCSRKSQGDSPTIYSLLPKNLHTLKPVGRLDRDSSGLILLTNDGDFAYRMTHPKFRKTKTYNVKLDKPLQPLHQQMISDHGVSLPDGASQFIISRLENDLYEVVMSEGRNRQIRRTFSALGYKVTYLNRLSFGNFSLGDLKRGEYRLVSVNSN